MSASQRRTVRTAIPLASQRRRYRSLTFRVAADIGLPPDNTLKLRLFRKIISYGSLVETVTNTYSVTR